MKRKRERGGGGGGEAYYAEMKTRDLFMTYSLPPYVPDPTLLAQKKSERKNRRKLDLLIVCDGSEHTAEVIGGFLVSMPASVILVYVKGGEG